MKIAIIPAWYNDPKNPLTGIFFKEQAAALRAGGIDAAILFPDLRPRFSGMAFSRTFTVEDGTPTFRLTGFYPLKIHPLILESWAAKAATLYDDYFERFGKPGLVHAHSYLAGAVALNIARRHKIPYVFTEHNSTFLSGQTRSWLKPVITEIMDDAAVLSAVSEGMKIRMETFTKRPIEVIPNFVDTGLFEPNEKRQRNGKTVFFSVGGLDPVKGYEGLIRAFSLLPNPYKGRNLSLRIGGGGRERNKLERLVRGLKMSVSVQILGELDQAQVAKEMRDADAYVSSSLTESFGITIIEAMACGTPVLATATAGARDIVTPEIGIIVPVGDMAALTEGLLFIADHYRDFDREKIRRLCVGQYGAEAVVKKWIAVYSGVIG